MCGEEKLMATDLNSVARFGVRPRSKRTRMIRRAVASEEARLRAGVKARSFSASASPFRLELLEDRLLLSCSVVINEIHYNPDIKTEPVEFAELKNTGDAPAELSGAA